MRRILIRLMSKAEQLALFGAPRGGGPPKKKRRHGVKQHVAKNPGGAGMHIVVQHERGEGQGPQKPAAQPQSPKEQPEPPAPPEEPAEEFDEGEGEEEAPAAWGAPKSDAWGKTAKPKPKPAPEEPEPEEKKEKPAGEDRSQKPYLPALLAREQGKDFEDRHMGDSQLADDLAEARRHVENAKRYGYDSEGWAAVVERIEAAVEARQPAKPKHEAWLLKSSKSSARPDKAFLGAEIQLADREIEKAKQLGHDASDWEAWRDEMRADLDKMHKPKPKAAKAKPEKGPEPAQDVDGDMFGAETNRGPGPKPQERAEDLSTRKVHHDAGEVVRGARKHKYESVHAGNLDEIEDQGDVFAFRTVNKARVFGSYDVENDRALGSTPGASYLKRELIKAVSGKAVNDAMSRRDYVEGARWLQAALNQLHTVAEVVDFLDKWKMAAAGHMRDEKVWGVEELAAKVGEVPAGKSYEGFSRFQVVSDPAKAEKYRLQRMAGKLDWGEYHKKMRKITTEHTIYDSQLLELGFTREVKRVERPDGSTGVQLHRKVAPEEGFYNRYLFALSGLQQGATPRQAQSNRMIQTVTRTGKTTTPVFWKKHWRAAQKIEKENNWSAVGAGATPADPTGGETQRFKNPRWRRATIGQRRVGGPEVKGEVTSDRLLQDFNLRGVQFGNWVNDEDAGKHLKLCHEAFTDLSDVIGVDLKKITHGGRLAIAFGARGNGHGAAHYEPSKMVINLTHTVGSGSLAHEWGHFMDHVLTATADPKNVQMIQEGRHLVAPMLSEGHAHEAVHPEVSAAFQGVMRAMIGVDHESDRKELNKRRRELKKEYPGWGGHGDKMAEYRKKKKALEDDIGAFNERYRANPKGGATEFRKDAKHMGSYWARKHEMFARCFESYVQDKLTEAKRESTYLVAGTDTGRKFKFVRNKTERHCSPYPQGEERKAIGEAMHKLVQALAKHDALEKAVRFLLMAKAGKNRFVPKGKGGKRQEPKPEPEHGGVGADVDFRHPETGKPSRGKVHAAGKRGATIVEHGTGRLHKVDHGHYTLPHPHADMMGGEEGEQGGEEGEQESEGPSDIQAGGLPADEEPPEPVDTTELEESIGRHLKLGPRSRLGVFAAAAGLVMLGISPDDLPLEGGAVEVDGDTVGVGEASTQDGALAAVLGALQGDEGPLLQYPDHRGKMHPVTAEELSEYVEHHGNVDLAALTEDTDGSATEGGAEPGQDGPEAVEDEPEREEVATPRRRQQS